MLLVFQVVGESHPKILYDPVPIVSFVSDRCFFFLRSLVLELQFPTTELFQFFIYLSPDARRLRVGASAGLKVFKIPSLGILRLVYFRLSFWAGEPGDLRVDNIL